MRIAGWRVRREDLVLSLFSIALGFAVAGLMSRVGGQPYGVGAYLPNVKFYALTLMTYICFAVPYLLVRHKPASPVEFLRHGKPARALWTSILGALPVLFAVGVFMPSFSLIKGGIPLLTTYSWDSHLIALDKALHGTDPWRLLQPVLGHPIVTAALAYVYHTWFLLIYAGAIYFALLVRDRALRYRYFLAYMLIWTIGGMAMAVGFASVGPCFLQPLLGNPHFADQMAYLEAANRVYPVATLEVQHELIAWYRAGDLGLGRGISAMPSMHVALAFLFFLAMRKVSRPAGWFFGAFCLTIMIASIHLGYHYAIDGYVSIALVLVVWWLAGKIVPRMLSPEHEPANLPPLAGAPASA